MRLPWQYILRQHTPVISISNFGKTWLHLKLKRQGTGAHAWTLKLDIETGQKMACHVTCLSEHGSLIAPPGTGASDKSRETAQRQTAADVVSVCLYTIYDLCGLVIASYFSLMKAKPRKTRKPVRPLTKCSNRPRPLVADMHSCVELDECPLHRQTG